MNRSAQTLCYFISALFLIGGLADVGTQFFEGQEIQWRIPLILIGTGVGLPIIIFPFHTPPPNEDEYDYDENDLSNVYQDGPGLLSSLSGSDSSPTSDYDDHTGSDGSD